MVLKAEWDRCRDASDPGAALALLNERITAGFASLELHCTAVCIDVEERDEGLHLVFANAAHPPLIVIGEAGAREVSMRSTYLGIEAGVPFKTERFTLASRERLLLYTDGLTEQTAPDGRPFGIDEACEILRSRPLDEATRAIVQKVEEHAGGTLADDVTVLAIEAP
jgi:serine phosphatase RsbU (regulator of sigma subunit)